MTGSHARQPTAPGHEEDDAQLTAAEITRIADALESLCERLDQLGAVFSAGVGSDQALAESPSFDYVGFAERFRGSRTEIRERQSHYAALFHGRRHVVDLACGRGEFVELLCEQDVGILGVDRSAEMVEACAGRDLPVIQADVFAYMDAQAEKSLDGIASFQFIEHLAPSQILRLLLLAERTLIDGAPIVLETVNPSCPEAFGDFYLDPTHVRPVPPGLLVYLFERANLRVESVRFTAPARDGPMEKVLRVAPYGQADTAAYRDYAVVGARAPRRSRRENFSTRD